MGYLRHHAILVTTSEADRAVEAHQEAQVRFPTQTTNILISKSNGYHSFAILPDGSKEGWEPSNTADENRKAYLAWLRSKVSDGIGSPYDWVEVQYGDDLLDTRVTASSDDDMAAATRW